MERFPAPRHLAGKPGLARSANAFEPARLGQEEGERLPPMQAAL